MTTTPTTQLYTFDAYLVLDAEQRCELVDGKLITMNPPTIEHFLIAKFIEQALDQEIKRCQNPWLCFREAGVRTNLRRSRLTDVCVVTLDQARELGGSSAVFQTPPLLAVEVVSPDSVKRDYRQKRSEYGALGIPEYWIIDPLSDQGTVLELKDGFYDETVLAGTDSLSSPLFPGLSLGLADIFAAGDVG
ncbi:MAG: Uma2 family endonuclease [Elainellaceae cyanobacterium]